MGEGLSASPLRDDPKWCWILCAEYQRPLSVQGEMGWDTQTPAVRHAVGAGAGVQGPGLTAASPFC